MGWVFGVIPMPVPKHLRITFRGVFAGTPEEWSFGVHMSGTISGGQDASATDVNTGQVTTALSTLLQSGAGFSTAVHASDHRVYVIGTDGRMEGNPVVTDLSADVTTRGNAANKYPPQIALCITTVAPNRGAARFGRFFLPGPTAPLDASLRLSVADAAGYADVATQFLKDVSDAVDFPLTTVGSSAVHVSSRGGSGGTLQEVDHVECGRVYDTLRSRRRSMLEERVVDGHIDW